MQIKGVLDNGWVLTNSHLGAPLGQDLARLRGYLGWRLTPTVP